MILSQLREVNGRLLGLLVVDELQHHLYFLKLALVRRILSCPINHYFGYEVDHLEVRLHLLIRCRIDIWLDHEFLAILAPLFPLRQEVERGRIKLLHISRLTVQIPEPLLDIGGII